MFVMVFPSILLRMGNVTKKKIEKIKTHIVSLKMMWQKRVGSQTPTDDNVTLYLHCLSFIACALNLQAQDK
jgi:hypothetical protein